MNVYIYTYMYVLVSLHLSLSLSLSLSLHMDIPYGRYVRSTVHGQILTNIDKHLPIVDEILAKAVKQIAKHVFCWFSKMHV